MSSDLQLNEPDPVACVKAWKAGVNVELDGYCGADGQLVNRDTSIRAMEQHRYRIIPPAPKTYTLAEAQVAYCLAKWVRWHGWKDVRWWHIILAPAGMRLIAADDWEISDTDPREKPTGKCCVCEQSFALAEMAGIIDGELLCRGCANRPRPKPDPREKSPEWVAGFRGNLSSVQKPIPRQVDVHEAYDVWAKDGVVMDPSKMVRCRKGPQSNFNVGAYDAGKPWIVWEEPPCPA